MLRFSTVAFLLFVAFLNGQVQAQDDQELVCKALSSQISSLSEALEERENSWITWTIQNEDSRLSTVPLEIAKESLRLWNVCGGVPSMLLVAGAIYPLDTLERQLRKKEIDTEYTRAFFDTASKATMIAIYPLGFAINFISYSSAFTYNELVKKNISLKLEQLKKKYEETCSRD
ncbi:MAG: hypothetical protein HRU09_18055 [Oligoflexales bacterium]|nr:hypothetical protein [Oligoflexales bacterium]